MIHESDGKACVIDVPPWVSRTMLNIIGQGKEEQNYSFLNITNIFRVSRVQL